MEAVETNLEVLKTYSREQLVENWKRQCRNIKRGFWASRVEKTKAAIFAFVEKASDPEGRENIILDKRRRMNGPLEFEIRLCILAIIFAVSRKLRKLLAQSKAKEDLRFLATSSFVEHPVRKTFEMMSDVSHSYNVHGAAVSSLIAVLTSFSFRNVTRKSLANDMGIDESVLASFLEDLLSLAKLAYTLQRDVSTNGMHYFDYDGCFYDGWLFKHENLGNFAVLARCAGDCVDVVVKSYLGLLDRHFASLCVQNFILARERYILPQLQRNTSYLPVYYSSFGTMKDAGDFLTIKSSELCYVSKRPSPVLKVTPQSWLKQGSQKPLMLTYQLPEGQIWRDYSVVFEHVYFLDTGTEYLRFSREHTTLFYNMLCWCFRRISGFLGDLMDAELRNRQLTKYRVDQNFFYFSPVFLSYDNVMDGDKEAMNYWDKRLLTDQERENGVLKSFCGPEFFRDNPAASELYDSLESYGKPDLQIPNYETNAAFLYLGQFLFMNSSIKLAENRPIFAQPSYSEKTRYVEFERLKEWTKKEPTLISGLPDAFVRDLENLLCPIMYATLRSAYE